MARAAKKGAPAPEPKSEPEATVAVAPVDAPPPAPVETPAADAADTPPAAVVMADDELIGTGIEVTALQPVRWRAGRKFTATPTVIPLDDLSDAELDAIQRDPMLSLTIVAVTA